MVEITLIRSGANTMSMTYLRDDDVFLKAHTNSVQIIADGEDNFLDMIEVVQDILKHGGLSNIIETILNLYAGIVYAICFGQDKSVTREWIEDNLNMFDAQEIFFNQMQKDRIGGKVIDFLYLITRQVVNP